MQQSTRRDNQELDLNLRKELVKCYIWSTAWYGAGTWTLKLNSVALVRERTIPTLRKIYQKYPEIFKCGGGE